MSAQPKCWSLFSINHFMQALLKYEWTEQYTKIELRIIIQRELKILCFPTKKSNVFVYKKEKKKKREREKTSFEAADLIAWVKVKRILLCEQSRYCWRRPIERKTLWGPLLGVAEFLLLTPELSEQRQQQRWHQSSAKWTRPSWLMVFLSISLS